MGELQEIAYHWNLEKISNKLKSGMMTQDRVLNHQKNPHVLDVGLPTKSAFEICYVLPPSGS